MGLTFVAIFSFVRSRTGGKGEGKEKDGCKHSWLLKGEIYSWVIKVYDWIPSTIGCSWPRGARSMNMNFMLLSIPWSFPCSSRLSYRAFKRLFPFSAPARLDQIPHILLAPLCAIMAGLATSWWRDHLDSRRLYKLLPASIPIGSNKAATLRGGERGEKKTLF